ncbi:hemolysin family protein [Microbacterium sp. Marseille-Q6648]|uniref:hemolysin family protein n=1 Tax=Microbacterium sp. Marseille-Q6648 TaxID=2937991 RepID=UPI00203F2137|nr:hemolysin family protein [Microbacterium sp. Marseille-Q6648]
MVTAVLLLLVGLLVIALIIAANGYFVAQEFAYMSVDRSRLRSRADGGDRAAQRALAVTKRTSFMLSGAQLGITVTGLLVGYVAEPLVGEALGVLLGGVGVPAAISVTVGTVLALAVATIVQMIFGELFPKNLAIAAPEPLARWLARSTLIYLAALGWLIVIFDKSSNALLRLIHVEPVHDVDSSATAKDLERIIEDSRQSGDLPEELSIMLDRILDFPDRDVEHAMVPRAWIDAVRPDLSLADAKVLMAQAHSRYPVIGENDQAVGVIHLTDLLDTALPEQAPVRQIMREPLVLPALMPLPVALEELLATRNEMACVIDEYGGFAGILTVEDIAEELVGEITDEHDSDNFTGIDVHGDDTWTIDGDVHLDEVERAIGHDLPRGDYETVAGLLIAERGDFPKPGDRITIALPVAAAEIIDDDPMITLVGVDVREVDRHVPSLIDVSLRRQSAAATEDEDIEAPEVHETLDEEGGER